ncbi:MAG: hypothetical protein R1F54_04320 [Candidatus Zeuxoniibacter abyssi]|nr:MAG: hypothetical protein R1F54_04320 [Candidatus Persebacteraceae bacterium AB1(2)]
MKKLSRIFGGRPPPVIGDRNALASFIDGNSAFVAQTTLYGYIKTRAGLEYFRLFEEADFVASVNIAKWNIYATCVGDLTLFCGAHICNQTETECLADYLLECMELIFSRHGHPPDAGEDYLSLSQTACERIKTATDWHADERAFSESPKSLVYWAPVADGHKQYDAHIVQNSIIFKWKETRDKFRRQADISALVKGIEQLSAEKSDVSPAL